MTGRGALKNYAFTVTLQDGTIIDRLVLARSCADADELAREYLGRNYPGATFRSVTPAKPLDESARRLICSASELCPPANDS